MQQGVVVKVGFNRGPEYWTVTTLPGRLSLVPTTPTHTLYVLPVRSHAAVKFMTRL